eukprot:gene4269-5814_t
MSERDPITTALESYVEAGQMAGAVALVWRDGKLAQASVVGWRDFEANLMVERDTIFRIASMTKPVTSTAAMMLVEEGRIALDEPITHWAPEFADMRVLRSPDGPLDEADPAARPITFGDLLTHRSGLTYGSFHNGPLAKAYEVALGSDIDSRLTPNAAKCARGFPKHCGVAGVERQRAVNGGAGFRNLRFHMREISVGERIVRRQRHGPARLLLAEAPAFGIKPREIGNGARHRLPRRPIARLLQRPVHFQAPHLRAELACEFGDEFVLQFRQFAQRPGEHLRPSPLSFLDISLKSKPLSL